MPYRIAYFVFFRWFIYGKWLCIFVIVLPIIRDFDLDLPVHFSLWRYYFWEPIFVLREDDRPAKYGVFLNVKLKGNII